MPFNVVVDLPYLADGAEVQLPGLRPFKNREETLVTDEEAFSYQQLNITHEPAYAHELDEDGAVVLDEEGQPVLTDEVVGQSQVIKSFPELLENFTGVSVEEVDAEDVPEDVTLTNPESPVSVTSASHQVTNVAPAAPALPALSLDSDNDGEDEG